MLEVRNATKIFGKNTINEHTALNHLNLTLDDGDFVTIVGSNGAGKSTLFNAICGNFLLDGGKVILDGEDITFMPVHRRARLIGRVFQDPMKGTAAHMTIEENLSLSYSRAGQHSFSLAIDRRSREFFQERLLAYGMGLEDRMQTPVGLLSGGQRQVVTLLMCTMSTPKLLLLDEHTAALDPATADKVMEITRETVEKDHLTTMMITHNMKQALTTGSRTIMMDSGEILLDISGKEREQMKVEQLLEMYSVKKKESFDNDRILLA